MKIMQIIPDFGVAGAEIMLENLLLQLQTEGHDVIGVSLFDFQTLITKRLEQNKINIVYLNKHKGFDFKVYFRLFKIIRQFRPNVIHTHRYVLPYVIPVTIFFRNIRKIHTVHNLAKKEVSKIHRIVNKIFYKFLKVTPVAISPVIKQSIVDEYHIRPNKVSLVYNGINLSKLCPKTVFSIDSTEIKVLHVGRFSKQKNHLTLVRAFSEVLNTHEGARLILIGEGPLKILIKEECRKLNILGSVEFVGQTDKVGKYLVESDIFVLPSLWEGMPITLIEAMATGIPIISSCVGGVPDMLLNRESGILIEGDKKSIVNSINLLIDNEELRKTIGVNSRLNSKRFSVEIMTTKYIKIYSN